MEEIKTNTSKCAEEAKKRLINVGDPDYALSRISSTRTSGGTNLIHHNIKELEKDNLHDDDILSIIPENHQLLRLTPNPYNFEERGMQKTQDLVEVLLYHMKHYGGIGLAATQIGLPERVFVMGDGEEIFYACFNPEIVDFDDSDDNMEIFIEGCLSFPGMGCRIKRPETITVKYQNVKGEECKENLSGLTARIFQHEFDHLNGVLMVDYLKPLALRRAREKQKKVLKRFKKNNEEI